MNLTKLPQPLFVGHRGYPARFPENTLASFEGAMQAGCDMIELDVTLTRDRQMVVIRDDTLDRTTSGRGAVRAHTLAAITRLDAGSWFDSRFASERVPELWEVIQLTVGRCMVNLEIKTSAFEADYPAVAYISNHGADQELVDMLLAMKAFSWHPRFNVLTRSQVDLRHAARIKVFPWTINTRKEAETLLAMGVDGVLTAFGQQF